MTRENDDHWFVRHIFDAPFRHQPEPAKHVAAAVSGGGDSMALLSYLMLWAADRDVTISALTVDHGLREGSTAEAESVAAFCTSQGIAHKTLNWRGWDGTGNLQAAAREARYALMAEYAQTQGIDVIALGHTENDQAETFLMRLARKSGVDGLAQMDHRFRRNGIAWVRPLLSRSRAKLRAHLKRQNIAWVEDPSNEDPQFERVQARKALLGLEELGITPHALSSVSHNLAIAKGALDHYTFEAAKAHAITEGGDLVLPLYEPIPVEISRRLTVAALQWIGGSHYVPRKSALGEMDLGLHQSGTHSLAGCLITRDDTQTRFSREFKAVQSIRSATKAVWDGRWRVSGPDAPHLEIRALGEAGLQSCPGWRDTGLPRTSLFGTPAVWDGDSLVAAPLAGLGNGWTAKLDLPFSDFLLFGRENGWGASQTAPN